jgi:hypothetical protein
MGKECQLVPIQLSVSRVGWVKRSGTQHPDYEYRKMGTLCFAHPTFYVLRI